MLGSRRYQTFESCLLTKEDWTQLKETGQTRLALGGTATEYLDGRRQRLGELLTELARDVDSVENVTVDEKGELHLTALDTVVPEAAKHLEPGHVRRAARAHLERRRPTTSVASAIGAFLAEHDLSPGSQRVYAGALHSLQDALGADTPVAMLDEPGAAKRLASWFRTRYDQTAPATRVRQLVSLRSACAFWRRRAWITTDPTTELDRPKVPLDRTKALTRDQIASLWQRDDVALRERVFWRLLYESAARANEILSLDIEDLDLANKRARVRGKGGAVESVFWQTGAALLLPRLLAGRTTGPVFLADRQPTRAAPSVDLCPHTGRA